jgi:Flp pilus assembly protein TadD
MASPMSAALQSAAPPVVTAPVPVAEMLAVIREYVEAGRYDAADRLLGHVLAAHPKNPESLHLSGFIAFKRNRPEQAAALMEQALAAGANAPRQLCNLAEVYRLLGRTDEGLVAIRRAAAMSPTDAVCHFNEAMLHYERLDTDACIRASRRAIALRPDMPEAHMRLGQTLLLTGEFEEGWEQYEWRYKIAGAQPLMPPQFLARGARPQWDGGKLGPDKILLLVADQGFGDVLMFSRYLPWAMERAAKVVVACSSEMLPLLARLFPGPIYHGRWDDIPDYAAFCPFSGLPRLEGTRADKVPAPIPYISPDPARARAMQAWLDQHAPPNHRRIGIAWAGRPTHNNDRNRTVPLSTFFPLASVPGHVFVSLQKGPAKSQLAGWPGKLALLDADPLLQTFDDTTALVASLDMVVCVDTSVGHVAGALGKPGWVLVPFALVPVAAPVPPAAAKTVGRGGGARAGRFCRPAARRRGGSAGIVRQAAHQFGQVEPRARRPCRRQHGAHICCGFGKIAVDHDVVELAGVADFRPRRGHAACDFRRIVAAAGAQPCLQFRHGRGQHEHPHHVARHGGAQLAEPLPVDVEQHVLRGRQRRLDRRPRRAVAAAEHRGPFQQRPCLGHAGKLFGGAKEVVHPLHLARPRCPCGHADRQRQRRLGREQRPGNGTFPGARRGCQNQAHAAAGQCLSVHRRGSRAARASPTPSHSAAPPGRGGRQNSNSLRTRKTFP